MIYLDNSATTEPDHSVVQSFQQVTERFFANPSSLHHLGGEAEKLLIKARDQASYILGVNADEIIFTSGGTEGNNLAIKGIALQHQKRGKHIITTTIEHPSVFDTLRSMEKLGFDVTYLPVNNQGVISVVDLERAIRPDTILVSVMHVNNEIGSIQPITEIGDLLKKHPKIFFHVDDVQGLGKVSLGLKKNGIDLCTYSGHKIHGLKGTGMLYVKNGTTLFPLFHGGNQEFGIRSGTENVAGYVSFVKALRLIKESESQMSEKLYKLQHYAIEQLKKMDEVIVNTPYGAAPHIINISVPKLKPEVVIHMLSEEKIFVSTKSACSSKQTDESRVLAACGYPPSRTSSGLRISLSYHNTKEELSTFVQVLEKSLKQLKTVLE
ncbi:cysteine desulfurase family protein [Virgibacillus sp. W0181]|uniref:cysteine desulfurase family protein n=1 Tax=Virgibacillus sp. W0181 TaxID=3391581 RepID=UPI003F45CFBB